MGFWLSVTELLFVVAAINASVAGVVRDGESGEPLAGAVVSLTDLDRAVATDVDGRYVFQEVPAGPQHVSVRRMGYAPMTLHALVPSDGRLAINVALRAEPVKLRVVEVTPALPIRGLDSGDSTASPERGLSLDAVRNDPLLAEPDVLQALGGGEVVLHPESPSGVHVRGGASDQITYLIDGIPVFSPYHAAGTVSAWNPDALARLELSTASPPPAFPDALSGAISATTRTAGSRLLTQGSVSTTQARATIDGPLGRGGAGYLLSVRSTFPGFVAPKREASYLHGEARDWLAKVESPFLRGRMRVLGYESTNEIDAASAAESELGRGAGIDGAPARNAFAWQSRSIGVGWTRRLQRSTIHFRAWDAVASATALWRADASMSKHLESGHSRSQRLTSEYRDDGVLAMMELSNGASHSALGIRAQRSRSFYRLRPPTRAGRLAVLSSSTPVWAAFAQHTRPLLAHTELGVAVVGALAAGAVHVSPSIRLRWRPSSTTAITTEFARRHQFAQSLRNPESMIGTIFPVDLYVGAGRAGVPVARSDQGSVGLEYRPTAAVRVGAQTWTRDFDGLVLVAPKAADPFAASDFTVGAGSARGIALEAGAHGARYGAVASYGVARVRLRYADTTYVPDHASTHTIAAGLIVFPTATASIRLGFTGVLGRRTTTVEGPLEWESCNLLDQGCELAGSPRRRAEPLGATRLPAYIRVDLGFRKHWHLAIAGRDGVVAVFGTVTNVLGRRNVLTAVVDPMTGERGEIEMRHRAPLVVGIDWRY